MQSARLFVTVSALSLGLAQLATGSVRADAHAHHVPAGVQTRWHAYERAEEPSCPVQPNGLSFDMPASVYVDPTTGEEIYLPTGETIDHVLPVVATRLPAPMVASVEAPPSSQEASASRDWMYYGGGAAALLVGLLGFVARRRYVSPARTSSPNIHTGLVL